MSSNDSDHRVVSGMRPTGRLHLGHYHGVLKNWIRLQHEYECFFFVAGMAQTTTEGSTTSIGKDGVLCVPAGTRHNIRNAGRDSLKLFTIYAPPQHPTGTVHRTKAEAQRAEAASHKTEE